MHSSPIHPTPARRPRHFRAGWAAPVALLLALLLLGAPGCDRDDAPEGRGGAPAAKGGEPGLLPEAGELVRLVAETRGILPRIPKPERDAAALAGFDPSTPAEKPAHLALKGEARLLRPGRFPRLPTRLGVELFLDETPPPAGPGGYLRLTRPDGAPERWPLLTGHLRGDRAGDFSGVFRVADPQRRLRYLVLLGVRYELDGHAYRSLEGYLVHPAEDGALSQHSAVYPVDFGYRHPEPPEPTAAARALSEAIEALMLRHDRWLTDAREKGALEEKLATLRASKVPADKAAELRARMAEYARRIDTLAEGARAQLAALREGLLAVYQERAALTARWEVFRGTNAYRWRTLPERRQAYLPLRALRGRHPDLEALFTAVDGDASPALREARAAMEQAVLREDELAPQP